MLEGRSKSPFAPIRNNLLYVPGMPGAHITSSETGVLYITQPIGFVVDNEEHALQLKDELAEWLITDESVELQFDDEPGRTFFAKIEGTIEDFQKFVDQRKGTITFICVDPYSYGPEIPYQFQSNVTIAENNGTAPANPIFELEVLAPITYAMIQNQNGEYMMIGRPVDLENQVPFQKYERIFHSDGSTDVGWTEHDSVDGGSVSGKMETNGTRFQAANYGTGTSWHGPAIKHTLPEVITDFRLETIIGFWNAQANQVGRVEIYLLDANDNAVGKLSMKDTQSGRAMAVGEIRAGDILENNYLINGPATRDDGWNDFYGMLRLEREGNLWKAYIGKIDQTTGNHHWRQAFEWPDTEGKFTRNVAQVAIHVGRMGTHTSGAMGIYEVSVYKINKQPDGVPYIADFGDKITFDHTKNGEVLINGEPFEDIDFGADFFKLHKGDNQLVAHPSNALNTKVRFREPFR